MNLVENKLPIFSHPCLVVMVEGKTRFYHVAEYFDGKWTTSNETLYNVEEWEYIDSLNLSPNWILTKENPLEYGIEVIGFHPDWIDEDFNPKGTRIGFLLGDEFISAEWNNDQDCYDTDEKLTPTHYMLIPSKPLINH